jgi:hypothetical protein
LAAFFTDFPNGNGSKKDGIHSRTDGCVSISKARGVKREMNRRLLTFSTSPDEEACQGCQGDVNVEVNLCFL